MFKHPQPPPLHVPAPDHTTPGITVIFHMGIKIPEQNDKIPKGVLSKTSSQGYKVGLALLPTSLPLKTVRDLHLI